MKRRQKRLLLPLLGLGLAIDLLGCGPPATHSGGTQPAYTSTIETPTSKEISQATLAGIFDQEIQLVGGRWEGEPFDPEGATRPTLVHVDDFQLAGDLDGDGVDEAIALFAESSGGSGTRHVLAVFRKRDGELEQLGLGRLGDLVKIRSAAVEEGEILLHTLQAGPEDPMYCPTELRRRAWTLGRSGLVATSSTVEGTLSLETLAHQGWVLHAFDFQERARVAPEITLLLDDTGDRITGSAGCNTYFAAVREAAKGRLQVGPVGTSRKICPSEVMDVERRFLRGLDAVSGYSFHLGRLALTWQVDESSGVLLFESRNRRRRDADVDDDADADADGG